MTRTGYLGAPMTATPELSRDARPDAHQADTHPARWRMLALLAVAELLGMSLWFATSAVSA